MQRTRASAAAIKASASFRELKQEINGSPFGQESIPAVQFLLWVKRINKGGARVRRQVNPVLTGVAQGVQDRTRAVLQILAAESFDGLADLLVSDMGSHGD
jgi:hypothetical protein